MIGIEKAIRELIDATIGIALAQQRQNAAIRGLADAMAAEESIDWRVVQLWHKTAQERLDDLCWAHGAGGDGEGGKAAAGG